MSNETDASQLQPKDNKTDAGDEQQPPPQRRIFQADAPDREQESDELPDAFSKVTLRKPTKDARAKRGKRAEQQQPNKLFAILLWHNNSN